MFDIGWQELFLIGLIAVIVIGPKELPRVLRTIIRSVRKIRGLAYDFQREVEEFSRESEIEELRNDFGNNVTRELDLELENSIDPTGEITEAMRELKDDEILTGMMPNLSIKKADIYAEDAVPKIEENPPKGVTGI